MIWIVLIVSSVMAGIAQTVTGFGSGVILVMALRPSFGMIGAPAITTSICLALSTVLAWKYRRYIDLSLAMTPLLAFLTISIGIISVIQSINLNFLAIGFGLFLVVLSAYYLMLGAHVRIKPNKATAMTCGALSGAFSGLFGVGGPVMALYFFEVTGSQELYAANCNLFFSITNFANLTARIINGIYTINLLPMTLVGVVGINIGKEFGLEILNRINAKTAQKVIYAFVGISGMITVVQHI